MVGFAELLRHAEGGFAVLLQKIQKFHAADEVGLRRLNDVSSEFIRCAGNRGGKAENFAGFRNSQNKSFAIRRGSGELHASAAQDKYPARLLPFHKKSGALGIGGRRSDSRHGLY